MTKQLKYYQSEVNKIEKRFSSLLTNRKPKSLYEPCAYIMQSGGKRLRPFLVLISNYAVNKKLSGAYNAAIAVELLHNFTLVHDDIMDNADKRRGRQTVHIKYDLSTAILAGDNLVGLAYEYLLKDCKDNDKKVLQTFTKAMVEVCEGQSMDTDFEIQKKVTIPEYDIMIRKKTAALAEMCCSIGAQIGGGSKEEVKALSDYGKYLGMAFQYQDDLLDIMGDESEFGKTAGGDLVAGKKTYLFLRALEKAKGEHKKALLKVIEKKGIRRNQVKKYREIYIDLGILKDAEHEIKRYTDKALKSLNKINNIEAKEILIWLANALIKRNK